MQRGGQVLIVLGLILGLIAAILVFVATRAPAPKIETRPVVVALQAIPDRVTLQAPMLGVKEWPADSVPADALSDIKDAMGKATQTKIFAGEPILGVMLIDPKKATSGSFGIPAGYVAFAIPASEVSTVGGAIQAGDSVDVLVTLDLLNYDTKGNESKTQATTQLVLQDVKVMRMGAYTPPESAPEESQQAQTSGKPVENRTITLLVNQQDALVLKYAREHGTVDLALRPFDDHETVRTDSVYAKYMVDRFRFNYPALIIRQ